MWNLAADPAASSTGSLLMNLWPIGLMFVVLYFLLIRPQQKRTKNRNSMLSTMKKGDKVVTIGGMHGTIMEINDDNNTIVVRVNDTTKLTFDRSAVNAIAQSTVTAEKK
jgi:preprotein translocase subunit YajC